MIITGETSEIRHVTAENGLATDGGITSLDRGNSGQRGGREKTVDPHCKILLISKLLRNFQRSEFSSFFLKSILHNV